MVRDNAVFIVVFIIGQANYMKIITNGPSLQASRL